MMTLKELQSWLRYLYKIESNRDIEIVVEPREVWKSYRRSPGFSKRGTHGKPDVIVWRLP